MDEQVFGVSSLAEPGRESDDMQHLSESDAKLLEQMKKAIDETVQAVVKNIDVSAGPPDFAKFSALFSQPGILFPAMKGLQPNIQMSDAELASVLMPSVINTDIDIAESHSISDDASSAQCSSDQQEKSPSPGDENIAPLSAHTLNLNTSQPPLAISIPPNSTNGTKEESSNRNDAWFQCFSTQNDKMLDAFVYSLFVAPRVEKKGDGFEHFECLNRSKFKCRFRLRVKKVNDWYLVEEKGSHSHTADIASIQTQGLAKSIREVVDQAFHEDWSPQLRQERIEFEMKRLGLPPNPRLSRQVDNRISYLRRVKNLAEAKARAPEPPVENVETNSELPLLQAPNILETLQLTPSKLNFSQTQGSPFKPVSSNGVNDSSMIDINSLLEQLQNQTNEVVGNPSPVKSISFDMNSRPVISLAEAPGVPIFGVQPAISESAQIPDFLRQLNELVQSDQSNKHNAPNSDTITVDEAMRN